MNEYQRTRFAKRIIGCLFNTVTDKTLAVFGFAFKKNTGDTRESPARFVCSHLLEEGARLNIYDPKVERQQIESDLTSTRATNDPERIEKLIHIYTDPYQAVIDAHAIVILTEWDEFKTYDYKKMLSVMKKPAFLFDGRKIIDHQAVMNLGYHTETIGKRFTRNTLLRSSGGDL
ncbi:hypothetical protein Pcinc_037034 [Petrolisthes cinctipes]|uniref:UDP-glucose/GDP-mannose dehydrogenase C-terminal domain-containing protein n=1 Tax=Petrolisthes cinctipes TaxID=88211 RepID=A0AAE1EP86_PETCI|nr:hypothetical protein Pcinc_037034 [Petrolisthes cinctipes]